MQKERIKMPAGAIIACILVMLFLTAIAAGIAALIMNPQALSGIGGRRSAEANATEAPAATQEPAPQMTAQPAGADPTDPDNNPSHALDQDSSNPHRDESDVEIIAECMDAVVSIDISMPSGYTGDDVYAGSGSGVIITDDGYIVTCNHVIEGASAIKVYFNDGSERSATLVGADSVTDIAVIKVDASNLPHAPLGNSAALRPGNRVYAIGNALGEFFNTVTDGIISGINREIVIENQKMTVLQTSAAINSGNSGGALFLDNGDLIGIVNAKSSGTTGTGASIEGLAYAVPIDTAKPIIADLMDYGFVTGRPWLGVSTADSNYNTGWFSYVSYPVVKEVFEGCAAEKAGVQVNDIIIKIDGQDINSSSQLRATINSYKIGDTITLTVMRGNETIDLKVTLQERTHA